MSKQRYDWISAKVAEVRSVHCTLLGDHMLRVTFDEQDALTMGNVVFGALQAYARVHGLRYHTRDWYDEPINDGFFRRWNFNVHRCASEPTIVERSCKNGIPLKSICQSSILSSDWLRLGPVLGATEEKRECRLLSFAQVDVLWS